MTSSAMIKMSGSVIANAMVDFRRRNFLTGWCLCASSCAHEAFELRSGPVDRLVDRIAARGALRDELGRDRLRVDLRGDPGRRRIARDRKDLARLRRIVEERPRRRSLVGPRLEIMQLRERGNVVALARCDHLLDR